MLRSMRSRTGLVPDAYTYGAVLSGLAKTGRAQKALEILNEMRTAGTSPDWVCLKAAMEACENRGSFKEAMVVLTYVSANCVEPSI